VETTFLISDGVPVDNVIMFLSRNTLLLPTGDKTISLRIVATPPREVKALLQRMKILIPNRPKMIENVVEKMA